MLQERIELGQIGFVDDHVRRRGRTLLGGDHLHDFGRVDRLPLSEERPQHVVDQLQAFELRGVQEFQVLPDGGRFGGPLQQLIERHAKSSCRVHVVDILVVEKRARLADQRIDDMAKVDRFLVAAEQSRHAFQTGIAIPQFQMILMDANIHEQANVFAADGVGVAFHSNDTVGLDRDVDGRVRDTTYGRQGLEHLAFLAKSRPTRRVAATGQLMGEGHIRLLGFKVATSP